MTHPGGRTLITLLAMFLIASLIARNASAPVLTGGRCIAFEELPLHTEYHVSDTIAKGLVEFELCPSIDDDGNVGCSGKELTVNNINLALTISPSTAPVVIAPAAASGWDSGLITAGASYQLQLGGEGVYTYQDAQNPFSTATIIMQEPEPVAQTGVIFLPLVWGGE